MTATLSKAQLIRYLAGCLASFIAGHIINFGVVQYVQEVLHSQALAGAALFVAFGTPLFLGMHGGALCDRMSPLTVVRRYLLGFILGALVLAATASVPLLGAVHVPLVLLGALGAGIGWAYVAPARLAYLGKSLPPGALRGPTIVFNLLSTLGFGAAPLLVGLVRQWGGWPHAFLLAAALFVLSLVVYARLPHPSQPAAPAPNATVGWVGAARDAFAYVRRAPLVGELLVFSAFVHLMIGPVQVVLPRLAAENLGLSHAGRGAFISALAPMLIVGGIAALLLRGLKRPGRAMATSAVAAAVPMMALGQMQNVAAALVCYGLFAVLGGLGVSLLAALLQQSTQDSYRGRVMSVYTISTQFIPAASGLVCGLLMTQLSPSTTLTGYTGVLLVLGLVLVVRAKAIRQVDPSVG